MASARLQITIESASNLYNADGVLAGKSDPYVIVEVPGQENMKFQTEVINNDLNPVWNHTGEIAGFMDGDVLQFTVMDKDTWPKPDNLLGRVSLDASEFYPNGLHAAIALEESKTNATLTVMISLLGFDDIGMQEAAAAVYTGEDGQLQAGMAVEGGGMAVEGGGMMMASGEQALLVNIANARGLYNADGFLAGKSDPYCICLIPEKPDHKVQTPVINNCLDPEWNHIGRIEGFQAGDSLEFQVWDSDTFPKPDQLLGKVTLSAQDLATHPEGLGGVLQLTGGLSGDEHGTLEISIQAETGAFAAEMAPMEMQAAGGEPYPGTAVMAGPTSTYSAPSVPGQACYSGSPVTYSSFPTTHTMTYGAPQTASMSLAPQAASMSLVSQPSMSYAAAGFPTGQVTQTGSMSMMSQPPMTYSTPGSQTGKVTQVIVHAPVTVSAEEFAQSNGTIVSTPLPVTVTGSSFQTGERSLFDTIGATGPAMERIVKKKNKSKSCC